MTGSSWLRGLAAAAILIAGCGDGAQPRRGGTAVIAAPTDLDHANPLVSVDAFTNEVLRFALFTPLVRYGPALELEPLLAEDWDLVGDTAVVFRLRRDLRWHDGRPVTAHDVLFTIERARDPATGFANAGYFDRWTGGAVVDSFTVRFSFEPHPEPLAGLVLTPPVPRHLLDTVPPERMRHSTFSRRPVGNGPFRFVSQRPNDRWVLEANPDYPASLGGPPLLDRVVWRVIPDNTAQMTELRTGGVDLALNPRPDQVRVLAERDGYRAVVKPSTRFVFIAWSGQHPPLDDPRVRRALAMGIDRDAILQGLRSGYGEVAVGPILPAHWSHDPALQPLPHDTDAARALLDEAGIRDRDGDGVLDLPGGEPFRVELKMPAGNDFYRDLAEVVRGSLADVGVDVRTRPTETATLFGDLTSPDRNFQAAMLAWSADLRLDLHDTFHSARADGPYQFASYRNARLDSLLDRAAVEIDRDRATPLWRHVQTILRDEQPWTPLYYQTDAYLVRERLRGVDMDIRGALLTLPRWWVDTPETDAEPDTSR